MWLALSGHAAALLLGAAAAALGVEFALIERGMRLAAPADAAEQDPYLWALFAADADPYIWAAFVAVDYTSAAAGRRVAVRNAG